MVWYGHFVEGNLLRILEETVGSPDIMQPIHVKYPVILGHVFRYSQSRVPPTLSEKYVGHVWLSSWKNNVNRCRTSCATICRWHNYSFFHIKIKCLLIYMFFTDYITVTNLKSNLQSSTIFLFNINLFYFCFILLIITIKKSYTLRKKRLKIKFY